MAELGEGESRYANGATEAGEEFGRWFMDGNEVSDIKMVILYIISNVPLDLGPLMVSLT